MAEAPSLQRLREALGLRPFVGESAALLREASKIPSVAACDVSVLIRGETGTGKELFASAIHYLSRRRSEPFVPVNCGAIPVELVENELFGHERAAYTGADSSAPGLVAEAEGGTLFLDEVDSLPPAAQVKLLRFLENNEYRPLGASRLRRADLRVVAASNAGVEAAVDAGHFRRDLYYRLNVVQLRIPPLRERGRDIPLLAEHFLRRYARELERPLTGFTPEALHRLLAHPWPGNVRELENAVQRAAILTRGDGGLVTAEDVDLRPGEPEARVETFRQAKRRVVTEFERRYLERALIASRGNVSRAARSAGKDRRSFWALIQKHRIDVDLYR